MKDQVFKQQIATHLKSIRASKGISLDATAKLTGVSKAMLGQIERQESSPTISVLWKIASGLETSFSAFFAGKTKVQAEQAAFPDDPNMKVTTLFTYQQDTNMEMFNITLTNHHKQMSSAHSCGVIEHVHVLTGTLSVFFDQKWHQLEQGESLRFFSDQEHGYQAISEQVSFQNIVCYPKL